MYMYQLNFPIDDFGLMIPFKQYYEKCCKFADEKICEELGEYHEHPERMRSRLRRALRALATKDTYWEGDVRGDNLYIGSVPDTEDGSSSDYYFALKQDNNGSSFIISEFPFIHLKEYLVIKDIDHPVVQKIQNGIQIILNEFAPPIEVNE
jgi:hypothetical protein